MLEDDDLKKYTNESLTNPVSKMNKNQCTLSNPTLHINSFTFFQELKRNSIPVYLIPKVTAS